MNEYNLSIDQFQNPKIDQGNDALYILLIRLLLMVPGSSQTHPLMGVGLIAKYRYMYMENIKQLETELNNQISTYIPNAQTVDIAITKSPTDSKEIILKVSVNNTLYVFTTNSTSNIITLIDL